MRHFTFILALLTILIPRGLAAATVPPPALTACTDAAQTACALPGGIERQSGSIRAENDALVFSSRPSLMTTAQASCAPNNHVLCLNGFAVGVVWNLSDGTSGEGYGMPLTDESGWFWFFSPGNLEVVVKVLDGCAINGHFWVFASGLTNVQVSVTVGILNGSGNVYGSPGGVLMRPIADTSAFACP
jgi:hypothetical protein